MAQTAQTWKQRIDLNTARLDQLLSIDGVDLRGAEAIITYRDAHGGFRHLDEVERLPQISGKAFSALREVVRLMPMDRERM